MSQMSGEEPHNPWFLTVHGLTCQKRVCSTNRGSMWSFLGFFILSPLLKQGQLITMSKYKENGICSYLTDLKKQKNVHDKISLKSFYLNWLIKLLLAGLKTDCKGINRITIRKSQSKWLKYTVKHQWKSGILLEIH